MQNVKYPAVLFFCVLLLSFVLPFVYYKNLPVLVASHFNTKNNADSWMNKELFLYIQIGINALLSAVFLLTTLLVRKLPESLINIPNKNYWLNGLRKEETFSTIQRFMYWFGSLTLMFVNALFLEVYNANISGTYQINSMIWTYLSAYVIVTALLTFSLIRYFRKPDASNQTGAAL